jgi:hypothetical protein
VHAPGDSHVIPGHGASKHPVGITRVGVRHCSDETERNDQCARHGT